MQGPAAGRVTCPAGYRLPGAGAVPSSRTWSSGTATCGRSTQVVVAEDDLDLGAGQVRAHSSLAYPHAALPVPLSIPLRSLPLAALPAFEDGTGGVPNNHVDLWMGGDSASTHNPEKHALLACENTWTRHATVIPNPPSNEPVDPTPMFTPPTTCYGGG